MRFWFFTLLLFVLPAGTPAQTLTSLVGGTGAAQTAAANDALGRSTPRSAIHHFLEACHDERFITAARYLDLRGIDPADRRTRGPELAQQLADILDRNTKFEVEQLSDSPDGKSNDGLAADLDVLLRGSAGKAPETLTLQRINQQGLEVWVVSQNTVARIGDLAALDEDSGIERLLPAPLVTRKILGTPLWVWLGLILTVILLAILSGLATRLILTLAEPLLRRYSKTLSLARLESLSQPVRLLMSVVVFRTAMEFFTPSALLRDYTIRFLGMLFVFGVAALVMRVVDLVADHWRHHMDPKTRALSLSVLPLGSRFIKVCLFLAATLAVLASWGYNTNAILAGLGVGGLAVALAAQKTIENLFGGVSLISDHPVLIGDFCKFGDQVGTVEDIGLRSTRIRTLDRTLVTVPNSSFSTMTIENYSRRDAMWFHPTLSLRRDTTPENVKAMMDAVTAILHEHPKVKIGGVPLRFTKIGQASLDLEIFAYVATDDFDEYLKVQSELLMKFLNASQEIGVGFAIPLQESFNVTIPPDAYRKAGYGFRPDEELPKARPPQA